MIELFCAFALSFGLTAASGLPLLPLLRRLKLGQSIREEGPRWHMSKSGTPTMGGLMFAVGITVTVLLLGLPYLSRGRYEHMLALAFAWLYGGIGFADDFFKVARRRNLGLTALQKLMLQLAAAAALLALMRLCGYTTADVYLPLLRLTAPLPWILFLTLALLYVAGFVNAVNLTDGVDGLCSGVTLPVAVFFAALCLAWNRPAPALFAAALAGGTAGFLPYNFHPARVFMGDTGSLFLGGALCGLALAIDAPLLLPLVGLVYLIEIVSVVLQVGYFKATGGRRLFKMTPIHHHFEMSGWSEPKIFCVFSALTALLCLAVYLAER
ncbi:MAG: phospho-N-acetylmuramoyl-pentapeptide-transferase [Oscillospiraceae bacterium]|jgi:phospho-N-acetylmuramoyl-pentapeptide-transferase|nr:phospho-N-acetylmuramoyl-pentapeptide-transferase [Oscillospiraceae bacterium]